MHPIRWAPHRPPPGRLLLRLLGALIALALVLVSPAHARRSGPDQGLSMGVVAGAVLPVPADLRAPLAVPLALRLEDLRALELSSKTFRAQGQVLLEWDAALR